MQFAVLVAGCLAACDWSGTDVTEEPLARVYITDRDGVRWDITQAVARYGFEPSGFQFGLGAFVLAPLILPDVAAPADSGYPGDEDVFPTLGVVIDGVARGYRLTELLDIELVDDTLAGTAIVVVHRPLISSPSVHARRPGATDLTLSASGWVYDNQSMLFDYETGSLWYRLAGERELTCIGGPLFGVRLPELAFTVIDWKSWHEAHPATGFMLRPPLTPTPTSGRSSTRDGTTTPNPTGSRSPAQ